MKYVTINDIARALGLSKSTVSRALNGDSANVGAETARIILETATRMGYRRNEAAVNLRKRSSHTVGIVVPEITTTFSMKFIRAVQAELRAKGYSVTIAYSDEDPAVERESLEMLARNRVDGIMISAAHCTANLDEYRSLLERKIPLVFFDRTVEGLDAPMVRSNDYISAFFLVEHLIYNGRRKILHIPGPSHILNSADRSRGWRDALEKFKLAQPAPARECGVGVADGAAAVARAIAEGVDFDSVFCFTETQALGAKSYLQEQGRHIPADVAVCCMSGTELATLVFPPLTAVEQSVDGMAKAASELLLEKMADFSTPSRPVEIESKVAVRAST